MKFDLSKHKTHLIIKSENNWGRNFLRFYLGAVLIISSYNLINDIMNSFDTKSYFEIIFLLLLAMVIYITEFKMTYKADIPLHKIDALLVNTLLGDTRYFLKLKNGKYRRIPRFQNYQEEKQTFKLIDEIGLKKQKLNNILLG